MGSEMTLRKSKTRAHLQVADAKITVVEREGTSYISLTDMVKSFGEDDLIHNWMRSHATLEYLGTWELLNNPSFKGVEFEEFKAQSGANTFHMTPKRWADATNAKGIYSKAGRGGGTFAHKDIALEFATWLSPRFKLYLIQEYQRLEEQDAIRRSEAWQLNRTLAKLNYRLHTSAIKEHLIPPEVTQEQARYTYASEADVLNVAVYGKTAKEWRDENPGHSGNMRDESSVPQLLVLANLESQNAILIQMGLSQEERLRLLNGIAIKQLSALEADDRVKSLPGSNKQLGK